MSDAAALRESLAKVDRLRSTASNAEYARVKIRLSGRPIARRGLLGFLRPGEIWLDQEFSQAETNAIYDALAQVRDDARRRADELEEDL